MDDGATKKIIPTFCKHMVDESGHLDHPHVVFALNQVMESVNIPFNKQILYTQLGA